MESLKLTKCSFLVLFLAFSGRALVSSSADSERQVADDEFQKNGLLANLVNPTKVQDVLTRLRQNIQAKWARERANKGPSAGSDDNKEEEEEAEDEGHFLVVALNELRKFKGEMKAEQARFRELKMRRELDEAKRRAKAETAPPKANGWFGGLFEGAKKPLEHDSFVLYDAPSQRDESVAEENSLVHALGAGGELSEAEAEKLKQAQTYADYLAYIHEHNERLKSEKLASIREQTKEFVRSLFVDEAKELAYLMLQQFIQKERVELKEGRAKQLLWKVQMNFVKYVCGVLADALAYVFGRKVLPKTAEEENPMDWMLRNMID